MQVLTRTPFASGAAAQRRAIRACVSRQPRAARARLAVSCVAQPRDVAASRAGAPEATTPLERAAMALAVGAGPLLLGAGGAWAEEGHSLLKGTTAALVHPVVMGGLFLATGYAGWLGWQWRRTRTIGDDIKALKAQLPKAPAGEEAAPPAPPALAAQIAALEKERKELVGGGYRDRHFNVGSLLLGGGVLIAVEGCLNTWTRTGKLFPGPHLFAGAGIVVLWALAAALVPAMQKGNDNARSAHIALNVLNLALFAWQVPTGLEIVGKVFEFTTFP
ncbi:hypothetical protein HT031_001306 [Scenedesmus sp. PABB004]|nr:hypothetical protein HT031_001306 [Scenedesmus sp. PABB004]